MSMNVSTFWSVPTSVYSASVLIGSIKVDRLEGLPDEGEYYMCCAYVCTLSFVVVVTL